MRKRVFILFLLISSGIVSAQTISLYFPHFGGQGYNYYVFNGEKNDTIQKGVIPADGRLTLTIPSHYKGYKGLTRWLLLNGGGLDFVVNGEDFAVSCTEAQPDDDNIVYQATDENAFFARYFASRQSILHKTEAIGISMEAYRKEQDSPMYSLLLSEQRKLQARLNNLLKETEESPLYAASYCRMSNFLYGLPLYSDYESREGKEMNTDQRHRYLEEELNMDYLFTTGLWKEVIMQAVSLYENESGFMTLMLEKLKATVSPTVYKQLAENLVSICEQYGWDEQEVRLVNYLAGKEGRVQNPTGKLKQLMAMARLVKGTKAPDLSQCKMPRTNVILVFYETGCNSCENEMRQLAGNYPVLRSKGYEVISISADNDSAVFENTAKTFPWVHKYCDGNGLTGADFNAYGVIGTPTFYIINKKGIIQGRYARLFDAGIL